VLEQLSRLRLDVRGAKLGLSQNSSIRYVVAAFESAHDRPRTLHSHGRQIGLRGGVSARMVKKFELLKRRSVVILSVASSGGAGHDFGANQSESAGVEDKWIGRASSPMSRGWWIRGCWRRTNIWPLKIAS
jgi:hypothetical protein